eukprot:31096-Pelagococcus_subviridis.AAC.2
MRRRRRDGRGVSGTIDRSIERRDDRSEEEKRGGGAVGWVEIPRGRARGAGDRRGARDAIARRTHRRTRTWRT